MAAAGLLLALGAPAAGESGSQGEVQPAALPGAALYIEHCVLCHGAEGKGDGPAGLPLVPMPRDFGVGRFKFDADGDGRTGTDRDLFLVIRDGAGAVGGNPAMVPFGHLGEQRIHELVAYVRSLARHETP